MEGHTKTIDFGGIIFDSRAEVAERMDDEDRDSRPPELNAVR